MGEKKRKEAAAKQAQQEWAAKPWYQRYWRTIASVIMVPILGFGWVKYRESAARAEATQKEKAKYGNLYGMQDLIPESMVEKTDSGSYKFENFLPKLHKISGKFQVNICFVKPPLLAGIQLSELPETYRADVMLSLSKWGRDFDFHEVYDLKDANLKIYVDNTVLIKTRLFAVTPHYTSRNPLFDGHYEDLKTLDNVILINRNSISHPGFKQKLQAALEHEFGHVLGIGHPETAIAILFATLGVLKFGPTRQLILILCT